METVRLVMNLSCGGKPLCKALNCLLGCETWLWVLGLNRAGTASLEDRVVTYTYKRGRNFLPRFRSDASYEHALSTVRRLMPYLNAGFSSGLLNTTPHS